ncbi:MAG: enhanced serine sensitivity protein SseB C-terminal domain-containing protein [Clostridia bacterium]|nr:enhanced serine sensitivity protein SseB C-terminal domain-containing protein [Clostridia bacterium]
MSKIQQLIRQYPQSKNEIIREIQKQDSIWAAYSPATKNCYADFHRGAPTAFLFSEEKYCNAFKRYLSTKNVNIETMENLAQNRIPLLSDLIRSGIEQVILDNGQTFVIFEMSDLIKTPDFSSLPKEERPVSNPSLIMHTNMYFQGISTGNTEKNIEYNMMKDIYEATFLLPISVDGRYPEGCVLEGFNTGTAVFDIPRIKLGASRTCIPLFTDWIELSKIDKDKILIGNSIKFNDILRICETGELVALNPMGFNMIMDKTTALSIRNRFETEPYVPQPLPTAEPETVEQAPVEQPPIEQAPVEQTPIEQAPIEQPPVEQPPVEQAPIEQPPVEQAPIEQPPVEQPPVEQAPIEQPPVEQAPIEQAPVQQAPVQQVPVQQVPVQQAPVQQQRPQTEDIVFFELQSVPDALIRKLTEMFDVTEGIHNVYLKGMRRNGRSGYLAIVDFTGTDPAVFGKMAQEAGPYTGGVPFTFVKYDSRVGRVAAEGAYPFYQRTTMTES